jgi:branched-chain amino acid transport system substrate-binding protein
MCGTGNHRAVVAVMIAALIALCVPGMLSADSIRIGVILSLTGNSASMGQSMREGLLLAVDEINKRNGVNGRKIEVDVQDSKGEPQAAVDAFNRIEASHPPLFYLSFLSNVGVALAPLADEKHVVLVGLMTSAAAFTLGHEWVFRFSPLVKADTAPLLIMLQDLKVTRLGILYSNEEYGIEEQKLLSRGFIDNGGTVAVQSFELKDSDFSRQIGALRDREAIVVASLGTGLTSAIQQLRAVNFGGFILAPSAGANPATMASPEMQGIYISAPIIYNPAYLFAHEAGDLYSARYQKPFNHWAAAGYDFVRLISGLLEESRPTRQGVRDVMGAGFQYSGVFGPMRLRSGDHDIAIPVYPAQVVNNTLKFR